MPLGLGNNLSSTGMVTPGIVTDSLVLKHNYDAGSVVPVSDGAAYFVKTNTDYIEIQDNSNLSFGDGSNDSAFSVSAWIYPKDVDRFRILTKSNASESEYILTINSANKPSLFIYDDVIGQQEGRLGTAITANQWYHIAATYNGVGGSSANAGINIYVNGVLDNAEVSDTGSYTAMHNDTGGAVRIGNFQDSGTSVDYADGYICNVGIWSSVLTQPQIKSIMNKNYAGLTSSEKTNLVSWWNLDGIIGGDRDSENGTIYQGFASGDVDPSTIDGLVLDNHDTTFTEVSVTNSDFTSGSGTDLTPWDNSAANKWERSGNTIISPNGVSLIKQAVLTNNIAHKVIVRAKNTVPGSTARLQVYFGGNNFANYDLTDDFQEYTFHGYQDDDTYLFLYNPTGAASTNVTIDWVKLYKYDGNVGVLV